MKPEDVEMEEDLGKEEYKKIYDFDCETEPSMEESDNKPLKETDEENELRPRSLKV